MKTTILHLINLDGTSITLKILRETYYPTHIELLVSCIASFPPNELLGKVFKAITTDYRPYIVSAFKTRRTHVMIAFGEIKAYKGYAYIKYAFPSTVFYKKLESEELYYKMLYDTISSELATLTANIKKCYDSKLELAEELHNTYSKILEKYIEWYKKSVGLASPEVQIIAESAIAMLQPQPPQQPQQPQQPPPKPSLKEKILKLFKRR